MFNKGDRVIIVKNSGVKDQNIWSLEMLRTVGCSGVVTENRNEIVPVLLDCKSLRCFHQNGVWYYYEGDLEIEDSLGGIFEED